MFHIPERRIDLRTRAEFDRQIEQLRKVQSGLMLYSDLRPDDNRVTSLLARCDTEIAFYQSTADATQPQTTN